MHRAKNFSSGALFFIDKTKKQVMQIMTIEDGSFLSIKSRIEGQKR